MMDSLHEECGVVGIYGHKDAAELAYLALYALQHRGQESAGTVSSDGRQLWEHRGLGLVADVFCESELRSMSGHMAVGHNRYSTTGSTRLGNIQPLVMDFRGGSIAYSHNGNLVNAMELRTHLESSGSIFQTSLDSEVIAHLMAHSRVHEPAEMVGWALGQVKGAYALVFMIDDAIIGARDPAGFRPLVMGKLGDTMVLASETCALDILGAQHVRDIKPGEIVTICRDGNTSCFPLPTSRETFCIFELIYFSRPDSVVAGVSVDRARRAFGRRLAQEAPTEADMVIAVPDSSNSAALGYAEESHLPFELGLIRNHYIGRTFICPTQSVRDHRVRIKFNPVRTVLEGKRVVVVDDSIVRGTTSRMLIRMLRDAGAREIHLRVSSPPIQYPCFYGIDTPSQGELIASSHSVEEIAAYLGVDSLVYLSLEGLLEAAPPAAEGFCTACFSGTYPVPFGKEPSKLGLEQGRGAINCSRTVGRVGR